MRVCARWCVAPCVEKARGEDGAVVAGETDEASDALVGDMGGAVVVVVAGGAPGNALVRKDRGLHWGPGAS
jgi:hypothetical protein